ncbi:MAG: DUF4404 family protein [Proteobacteria bacterium]|nr:DUF4404 family protein [Pseudomonadota bacterium]
MNEKRIKALMGELLGELEQAESIGDETVSVARQLESDIHDLVNPEVDTAENTVLDDAIALEASFAASHPIAEKILRELINNLSKIGI